MNRPKSYKSFAVSHINKLQRYWAKYKATQVTTSKLTAYQEKRQRDGVANATINREMAMLRRSFRLAAQSTPRLVPIYGDMRAEIDKQRAVTPQRCPWVFNRAGRHILSFRKAWDAACEAAGLKGLRFHDLRRSAIRNMVRAGVPDRVAMAISGHKTRAILDRYNIVSGRGLAEAGEKIGAYLESSVTKQVTAGKVCTAPGSGSPTVSS
jgi:site-specific recombinase XerD